MACGTNLGAMMAALNACPAMPVPRDWIPVDKIPVARAAPNRVVHVDFSGIPVMDSRGRIAHIRAIKLQAKLAYTLGAANDLVTPYQLRGLFSQIYLTDIGGHEYYAAMDGRSAVDDSYFRGGDYRMPRSLGSGIALNAGAGAAELDIGLLLELVSSARGASPIEGLIPVAALQAKGTQALRFRLEATIPGAPAGVTVDGFTADDGDAGMEVLADVVYLDVAVIDGPWQVREFPLADKTGTLPSPESRHEYLVVRHFPEDAGDGAEFVGQQCAHGVDGVKLTVAGFNVLSGATISDLSRRETELRASAAESAANMELDALELPAEAGVDRSALILIPPRPREHSAAGPVVFKFNTRPGQFTRYLHRTTACDDGERTMKIKAAITREPCTVSQLVGGAEREGVLDATAPKILALKR